MALPKTYSGLTLTCSYGENMRRHGRVRCGSVASEIGEIQEISASGLKVRTRLEPSPVDSVIDLTLGSTDGAFSIKAKVVWVRPIGVRYYELGLEFVDLSKAAYDGLIAIVRRSVAQPDPKKNVA